MGQAKLFGSRWAALIWSAGMLWTAVDVAGVSAPEAAGNSATAAAPADEDATGLPIDNGDLAILANAMKGE